MGKIRVIVRSANEPMIKPVTMEGQVNAHSSIGKGRENAVSRRLRSRAFRTGLREGLGAPALFDMRPSFPRAEAVDVSVATAWKVVGDALKSASQQGVKRLGEVTGKAKSTGSEAD